MLKNSTGLTLIELIIVIGIIMVLTAIASVGILPRNANRNSLDTTVTTVITEIRAQQVKAMVGDTEGRSTSDTYGIYFENGTYTLFHGDAYNAGETSNLDISLSEGITFSDVTFPNDEIVFEEKSGEVADFASPNNTITIQDTITGEARLITINNLGVIVSVTDQ